MIMARDKSKRFPTTLYSIRDSIRMSRKKKRTSATLDKAQTRLAALKSIDKSLDLGHGVTVERFNQLIEDGRQKMESYNTVLSTVDQAYVAVVESEKTIAEWTERMLLSVASKYGKNSDEYKMAGGTRRSDRKPPKRREIQEIPGSFA
jgi:uncharacterized protein YukE